MQRACFPKDRARLHACIEQQRKADEEPSKVWKEWWALSRAVQHTGVEQFLPQPFVAEHVDTDGDGADFRISLPDGAVLVLEVTEATTKEDRREIALTRGQSGGALLGAQGGRFAEGASDADYAVVLASDIKDAIARKSNNRYGPNSALLIYPNSNAGFARPEFVAKRLQPLASDSPFTFVLVIGAQRLIALTKEAVHVFPSHI